MDSEIDNDAITWMRTANVRPPEDKLIETKMDDGHGVRNVQTLRFRDNLWWNTDGTGTYVYYVPTHWRPV